MNVISPDFQHGWNTKIGQFCHIHPQVKIGNNCQIRSYVELRPGTIIGDNCYIDSGVKTSGQCTIGDNVTIRYDSIIARGTTIRNDVFIAPQLMTENLNSRREPVGGAYIDAGVFIGTNVTLASGIKICRGVVVGRKANVCSSLVEPGVYVGNPARKIK